MDKRPPGQNTSNAEEKPPEVFPVVKQEKLNGGLTDYLRALAVRHPFAQDIRLDGRRTFAHLKEIWPKMPGWEKETDEFLHILDDVVHATPSVEPMPNMVVRVAVAAGPLTPTALPEAHEATSIASFDSINGIARRTVLPALPSEESEHP